MAKTGYLIVIYQDVNPSSPTYNQTREERTQSEEFCPSSAEAHWIEDTKYCELTENGMLTGYEITVYRDIEPLSSTYNQTREEKELNPTECEADSSLPNWQNIGDPFCRQKVYMPGGLMGNDGYMIQQQQDMNEYSETADEIREIETLDLTNCPLPNTLPEWEVIYEACHIIKQDGQLMFDGTKDVVRIDRNQYSPSWNDNVPETVNVEDLVNCPPDIEVQYRWVGVSGEYMCVGYDKHSVEKKQRSTDGETWVDVMPLQTRAGELIETNSEDCGYEPTIEYRWVVVDEQFICVGFDKHTMEKKQQSVDGGEWTDVVPTETRAGELIEANSEDCGYEPTFEYRWVVITGQYECVDYDKYAVEKKQQSSDGGTTWTDVEPLQTRTGSLIERNSTDCGYLEPQYRWVAISDAFVCVGYDKHEQEKQQVSYDNGTTWEDVVPTNTRTGSLIEHNSEDCGYIPETVYRWVTVSGQYVCVDYAKYSVEKKQQSVDGGTTWTDVVPTETRNGSLIERYSEDCGYTPISPSEFVDLQTDTIRICRNTGEYGNYQDQCFIAPNGTITTDLTKVKLSVWFNKDEITYTYNVPPCTWMLGQCIVTDAKYVTSTGQWSSNYPQVPYRTLTHYDPEAAHNLNTVVFYIEGKPGTSCQLTVNFYCNDTVEHLEKAILTINFTENECRWTPIEGQYVCDGFDKYAVEKNQENINGVWTDITPLETRTGSLIEHNSEDCGFIPYSNHYLTVESLADNNDITFTRTNGAYDFSRTIYVSTDGGTTWTSKSSGYSTPTVLATLNTGDKLLIKGTNNSYGNIDDGNVISSTNKINVYGNIMSLVYGDNFIGETEIGNSTFVKMFSRNPYLISAENLVLPSTTTSNCYYEMFWNCTSLTKAPELPATTLASSCYYYMFWNCTSLETAPELPATALAEGCYSGMFYGCTSLTTAPELPATTLTDRCYGSMFYQCTSLETAPGLPATTLASSCYAGMFNGCTSLRTAPVLPAKNLVNNCYKGMFRGCTSLTTAPELPTIALADGCYMNMFYDCTNLVSAPELPATTLVSSCYAYMFNGCTSLTKAPELPATTLKSSCYSHMFYGCTSLNYIKAMFTTKPSTSYTSNWVEGVASSGTFVKNSAATWNVTGINGIPTGWTVVTE